MKIKALVTTGLALSLVFGGIAPLAKPTEPTKVEAAGFTYTKAQTDALNYLNGIRKKVGLDEVKLNPFLNKMAENHVNYLVLNNTLTHYQEEGKKGFTGKTPADRAKAVGGSFKSVGEIALKVSWVKNIQDGIDEFMPTAYHRKPLVSSRLSEIGVAFANNGTVVINYTNEGQTTKESVYPYDGQTNVGIGFYGKETPNPLAQFKVEKSGFIISYTHPTKDDTKNLKFQLKDSKGVDVPVFIEKDKEIWFFFPKKELLYNETYTANVNYSYEYIDFDNLDTLVEIAPGTWDFVPEKVSVDKTWSFTTMKAPTTTTPTPTTPKPTTPKPTTPKPTTPAKIVYADAQKAYWSDAMIWAVNKKYMNAFLNQTNPKTKKKENLLKPFNAMTEAEYLIALTKYMYPTEYVKTKATDPKFTASVAYQLAAKYKLPTKATLKSRANATKPITRSTAAVLFASAHHKKVVNETTAFNLLKTIGATTVKTYPEYKPKDILNRANGATFIKKYEDWKVKQKK